MVTIKKFIFNPFQVNSYLIYDETLECVLVDASCYEEKEKKELKSFLAKHKLTLVKNISTHCHIDHILGNTFVAENFGVYPEYHEESVPFFLTAKEIGNSFGFALEDFPPPEGFIQNGDIISFGNNQLRVIYTPGHAAGSICLYHEKEGFVMTGDVLFKETIGRTDLPSGNFNLLMRSIREKLFALPDETIIYPGHGPETTIGYEKANNSFIR